MMHHFSQHYLPSIFSFLPIVEIHIYIYIYTHTHTHTHIYIYIYIIFFFLHSRACGIFIPWLGIEPMPLKCKFSVSTTGLLGKPPPIFGSSLWILQTQSSLLSISIFHLSPDLPTSVARMRNRLWKPHPERLWRHCCPGCLSHRVSSPLWCGTIFVWEPETQFSISPCSRLLTAFLLACLQTPYISYL